METVSDCIGRHSGWVKHLEAVLTIDSRLTAIPDGSQSRPKVQEQALPKIGLQGCAGARIRFSYTSATAGEAPLNEAAHCQLLDLSH